MSRKTLVTLREQLDEGQVAAPFIYDCLSGRVAENTGFRTFVVSTSALAMTFAGAPDIGILTADEVIAATARIADFLPYPVIAEFSGGFGDSPYVVWRNVLRLTRADAAAVIIDDTTTRRGTPDDAASPRVISRDEYLAKIRAAVDAVQGTGTLVIAASNAKHPHGLPEAIARVAQAKEAGAHVVAVRGLSGIEECRALAAEVAGPKMFDEFSTERDGTQLSAQEIDRLGFRILTLRYMEKAALYGLMDYGLRTRAEGTVVYVDHHDFDGLLPSMDHHQRLFLEWEEPWQDIDEAEARKTEV